MLMTRSRFWIAIPNALQKIGTTKTNTKDKSRLIPNMNAWHKNWSTKT